MFAKRHWKVLSLGIVSLSLAIAFNLIGGLRESSPGPRQARAIAMTQPLPSNQQINQQLLSLLPAAPPPLGTSPAAVGSAPVAVSGPVASEPVRFEPVRSEPVRSEPVRSEPLPLAPAIDSPLTASTTNTAPINTQFGHLPYTEASRSSLVVAGYYGSRPEQLQRDAAAAYQQMIQAAQRDGVEIIPISGFRDIHVQADLFTAQTARRGSQAAAARISAPPGHSEHHTGYAIDLGDGGTPSADLEVTFERTPAFRWLNQNAAYYGFELSFPPNNFQNVSYEPWHWRFVGTPQAQQTFAQAR